MSIKNKGYFSEKRARATITVVALLAIVSVAGYSALNRYADADTAGEKTIGIRDSAMKFTQLNYTGDLTGAIDQLQNAYDIQIKAESEQAAASGSSSTLKENVTAEQLAAATMQSSEPAIKQFAALAENNLVKIMGRSNSDDISMDEFLKLVDSGEIATKPVLENVPAEQKDEYIAAAYKKFGENISVVTLPEGTNYVINKALTYDQYVETARYFSKVGDGYIPLPAETKRVAGYLFEISNVFSIEELQYLILHPDKYNEYIENVVYEYELSQEISQAKDKIETQMPGIFNSPGLYYNTQTGRTMFKTLVYDNLSTDETGDAKDKVLIGYATFDPQTKSYNAQISKEYNGKEITLYSDAVNGIAYIDYGNADGKPLLNGGMVKLMSFKVSKDGVGGSFELMGRLFTYNPSTKAIEYTIPISFGNKSGSIDGTGITGNMTIDSKGNVRGSVDLTLKGNSQGTIFFDRNGNFSYGRGIYSGGTQIGSINFSTDGIAGTVNLQKFIGANIFVDLGTSGISGFGGTLSISDRGIPLYFSLDGGTSIGVPGLSGLVNLSLGKGGLSLNVPIIGNIHLFGGDDRPDCSGDPKSREKLVNSDLVKRNEDGTPVWSFDTIYSCRKINGGLRGSYNSWEKYTISEEDQIYRSAQIFKAYNEALKRNPTKDEWLNWYFFFQNSSRYKPDLDKKKTSQSIKDITAKYLKEAVRRETDEYGNITNWDKNSEESKWIDAGKNPEEAPGRPPKEKILDADPFAPVSKTTTEDKTSLDELFKKILEMAGNDPNWAEIVAEIQRCKQTKCTWKDEVANNTTDGAITGDQVGTVSVATGYSTYVVPANVDSIDASKFVNKGIEIFQYNTPSKKWKSTALGDDIRYMVEGVGYYLYNPMTAKINVPLVKVALVDTSSLKDTLTKGWNLKANSEATDQAFATISHYVSGTKYTISALASNDLIYKNMFIIKNGAATTAEEAFQTVSSTATDVPVPAGYAYWIYLK